ncbi:MAG: TonB-dependent receptor plug domain-containing protein [Lacunisphaera sp.]|nr:TonB-dependent receptor plug domain-containing protein [Lacunisphaera sp.]
MKKSPRTLLATAAGWLVATTVTFAQTVTTPVKDEVIVLTPFEVNASADTGYRASGTLAGTRLRTELRDVAASISVVTKDFMNDIAANNLEDLLTYTAGTEVEGLSGNFSGSGFNSGGFQEFNGASRRPQGETRVRGLGAADQTRDYFLTDTPMDGYNIDRVEVNRGPNAILFGLGRPGGIVNSGMIKALTNKTKTKVEAQFDQEASRRLVFDHNQVLIKDKLALRFATLLSDKRYQIKPAFIRDERYFITGTYRPWKGAQLRLSTEKSEQKSAKPYTTTPMDSLTWWLAMGKPVYNPTTGLGSYLGTPSTNVALRPWDPVTGAGTPNAANIFPFTSSTNRPGNLTGGIPQNGALQLVSEDPNSSRLGITGLDPAIVAMEYGNTRGRLTTTGAYANDGLRRLGNAQDYMRQINTDKPLLYNFWKDQRIMDPAIFDFYNEMLEGPNKREWAFWDTFNANFSQDLGSNAGFEITYDWQKLDSGFVQPLQFRQNTINIDINTHLMNGMPNPNLGRPMTNTALGFQNSNSAERESYRANAFYRLDFTGMKRPWLAKLLGRHVFTGNYTEQTRETYSFGARLDNMGNDYQAAKLINSQADLTAATAANPNRVFNVGGGERSVVRLAYHGPSLVNATSMQGYSFSGVTALQNLDGVEAIKVLYYERPANVTTPLPRPLGDWKTGTFSIVPEGKYDFRNTTSGGDHAYEKVASTAFVANSYWWDDTLVSTLGWRKDTYDGQVATGPLYGAEGLKVLDPSVWMLNPPKTIEATKFNYGLVLHTPPFLRGKLPWGADVSVSYNKADNFQPTAQRYDIYDNAIAPTGGQTEEWSVLLSLFDDKLQLRAIRYETSAVGSTAQFTEIQNRLIRRLENQTEIVRNTAYRDEVTLNGFGSQLAAWDAWEKTAPAQTLYNTFRYQFPSGPLTASTPNIIVQERIQEVVATQDVVAEGYEFDVTYNPTPQWRISFNAAEQITINDNTGLQFRQMMDALAPVWGGTAARLPLGMGTTNDLGTDYSSIDVDVQKQELLDGGVTPELRRWRFNAVTNYTFKGGKLNGVRIGAAYRWQDKAAIGFPIKVGPDGINGIVDVMNPYYGEAETNVDAWIGYSRLLTKKKIKWNVQLNVKNIGTGDRLIPVSTQPDGTIDTGRIATAQIWSLTNSFEF